MLSAVAVLRSIVNPAITVEPLLIDVNVIVGEVDVAEFVVLAPKGEVESTFLTKIPAIPAGLEFAL